MLNSYMQSKMGIATNTARKKWEIVISGYKISIRRNMFKGTILL